MFTTRDIAARFVPQDWAVTLEILDPKFAKLFPAQISVGGNLYTIRHEMHVTILDMHRGYHIAKLCGDSALRFIFNRACQWVFAVTVQERHFEDARLIVKPTGYDVKAGYADRAIEVAHPDAHGRTEERSLIVRVHVSGLEEFQADIERFLRRECIQALNARGLQFGTEYQHVTIATRAGNAGIPISSAAMLEDLTRERFAIGLPLSTT